MGAVGDDAVDVPLVGVQEEANQRLLVVGIAPGVGFDDQPQPGLIGQNRRNRNGHEQ